MWQVEEWYHRGYNLSLSSRITMEIIGFRHQLKGVTLFNCLYEIVSYVIERSGLYLNLCLIERRLIDSDMCQSVPFISYVCSKLQWKIGGSRSSPLTLLQSWYFSLILNGCERKDLSFNMDTYRLFLRFKENPQKIQGFLICKR